MEEYLTFARPEFLDFNKIMLWVLIGNFIFSAILFGIWKFHRHNVYPTFSVIFSGLTIVALAVMYFFGGSYNNTIAAASISENYDVIVTDIIDRHNYVISHGGQLYPCETSSFNEDKYYVVCNTGNERLLLNDIVADPEK